MSIGFGFKFGGILGELQEAFEDFDKAWEKSVMLATKAASVGCRDDLRGTISSVGLGNRLPNTVHNKTYPERDSSLSPAALIYSRAPEIMWAFTRGAIIHNNHGRYLAIPTENVKRTANMRDNIATFKEAGIPLRFVPPSGQRRIALLVADNFRQRTNGKVVVALNKRKIEKGFTATAIMFLLVPQVEIKARFDAEALTAKWGAELARLIGAKFEEVY